METWLEDTCCVCKVNDTNYLDDACGDCEAILRNEVAHAEFVCENIAKYYDKRED